LQLAGRAGEEGLKALDDVLAPPAATAAPAAAGATPEKK